MQGRSQYCFETTINVNSTKLYFRFGSIFQQPTFRDRSDEEQRKINLADRSLQSQQMASDSENS